MFGVHLYLAAEHMGYHNRFKSPAEYLRSRRYLRQHQADSATSASAGANSRPESSPVTIEIVRLGTQRFNRAKRIQLTCLAMIAKKQLW
jgi:hypothetical protein